MRFFLVFSLFLLSYVVSAIMGKPDWSQIGHAMVHPDATFDFPYLTMVIGIVGTTIAVMLIVWAMLGGMH